MTLLVQCICDERRCKHFVGIATYDIDTTDRDGGIEFEFQAYVCKAFPEFPGIPTPICRGIDLHDRPWKTTSDYFKDQQNKIVYEKED